MISFLSIKEQTTKKGHRTTFNFQHVVEPGTPSCYLTIHINSLLKIHLIFAKPEKLIWGAEIIIQKVSTAQSGKKNKIKEETSIKAQKSDLKQSKWSTISTVYNFVLQHHKLHTHKFITLCIKNFTCWIRNFILAHWKHYSPRYKTYMFRLKKIVTPSANVQNYIWDL